MGDSREGVAEVGEGRGRLLETWRRCGREDGGGGGGGGGDARK